MSLTHFALAVNLVGTVIAKPFHTFKSIFVFLTENWFWKITKIVAAVGVNLNLAFLAAEQKQSFVVGVAKLKGRFLCLPLL